MTRLLQMRRPRCCAKKIHRFSPDETSHALVLAFIRRHTGLSSGPSRFAVLEKVFAHVLDLHRELHSCDATSDIPEGNC